MKIQITETKTIHTTIEVEANSIEEAKEIYYDGGYGDQFCVAEMEQWNVMDSDILIIEADNT